VRTAVEPLARGQADRQRAGTMAAATDTLIARLQAGGTGADARERGERATEAEPTAGLLIVGRGLLFDRVGRHANGDEVAR